MPPRIIHLRERRSRILRLPFHDQRALRSVIGSRIAIDPTHDPRLIKLTPRGIVGRILTDRCEFHIAPKLRGANLDVLFEDTAVSDPTCPSSTDESLSWFELLARRLADRMIARAQAGLNFGEQEQSHISTIFQGRLDLPAQLRDAMPNVTRFHLHTHAWQSDQPLHQIPRTVAGWVVRHPSLSPQTHQRLLDAIAAYADISELRDPRGLLVEWLAKSLDADDRAILEDCRWLLSGDIHATCCWVDLEAAFEAWVTRIAVQTCRENHASLSIQPRLRLDAITPATESPIVQPDLIATSENGNIHIIDAKWKRCHGHAEPADLHQILAYIHTFGAVSGHLIYPGRRARSWQVRVSETGTLVGMHTVPLVGSNARCRQGIECCLRTIVSG